MSKLPADIGTMAAVARAQASAGSGYRVFDWNEAARRIVQRGIKYAEAGLISDWSYTGGAIFANGVPVSKSDTYTFLASNWAIPGLLVDDDVEECWTWESETDGWGSRTYWPESARLILRGDS